MRLTQSLLNCDISVFSLLFCLCLTFDIYIYKEKINYISISIGNATTLRYIHLKKTQGEEVHKETIGLIWVMTSSTLRTGKYL